LIAAAVLAVALAGAFACWTALGDGDTAPVPDTDIGTPPPAPGTRHPAPDTRNPKPGTRFEAYLPLVEPYENIPDPDPESPEGKLAARLDALVRAEKPGRRRRLLATLRVRLDYKMTRSAEWTLAEFEKQLAEITAGRDPLAAETGERLRGYYAANDSSCQSFSLALPEDLDPERKYPLLLELHCHGWGDWYRPFQGYASRPSGAIVAAPHGRGSCDYLWIAEDDALAVIDAVAADFPVDPDRVYVTGWSMGGTGSFHLPGRYPDRFAASAPKAGNADFTAWEEAWKEDRQRKKTPLADARMFLRWKTAPVTYAENFLHVPIAIDHGADDSINPVGHSKSMAGRLKQLGYANVRFRAGEGGHGWGASTGERFDWMKQFKRPKSPARVRLKTGDYRHGSAYWLEITRITDRMKMAELDITVVPPDRIEVKKCENVRGFKLRLGNFRLADRVRMILDGKEANCPGRLHEITVLKSADGLTPLDPASTTFAPEVHPPSFPPAKRRGLEGPICDAFRDPFMVVVGTTAKDPFERRIVREEAERWRRQWRRRFQVWPPVKDDTEVTDADIASKNLMLFGGPRANSLTARVMPRLPARIEGHKVVVGKREYTGEDLGLKLCYPNPLNPDRLVILQAATTWRGMWQMTHRFGNWFDWMPLDNREWFDFCVFDDRSTEFETMLDVGFLDEDWSLRRANRWHGVAEWRAKARPRAYPRHRQAPDADSVRLGDIWPRQIDTARGPLHVNRGYTREDLCIGSRKQSHGLGQWIESAVAYDIGGNYRSLRTAFGVDGAGQTKISSARRSAERTRFEIWGDGRLLAAKSGVAFGDPPGAFEVDVTGVRGLTLRILRGSPQGWLYGPMTWGQPVLSKKPLEP
jgi:dienelactone hydrolase